MKASLHESGRWHISFTEKFFEAEFTNPALRPPNRFVESWPRPTEIVPGVTLAHRIVVPWDSPTVAARSEPDHVVWVAPASEGRAIEFIVLITNTGASHSEWPGKDSMASELVGSFPLPAGERVWVVYTSIPFQHPPEMQGTGRLFGSATKAAFESPNLRAVFFGNEPDGSRIMYDVPLRVKAIDG